MTQEQDPVSHTVKFSGYQEVFFCDNKNQECSLRKDDPNLVIYEIKCHEIISYMFGTK